MNIRDLRVGNWVYSSFSQTPCKVTETRLDESGYGVCKVTGVDGYKDVASLSPIPLTNTIINKNFNYDVHYEYGYHQLNDDFCLRWLYCELFLCHWEDIEYSTYRYPKYLFSIDSVNQLQNLLRDIRIEKEIIL